MALSSACATEISVYEQSRSAAEAAVEAAAASGDAAAAATAAEFYASLNETGYPAATVELLVCALEVIAVAVDACGEQCAPLCGELGVVPLLQFAARDAPLDVRQSAIGTQSCRTRLACGNGLAHCDVCSLAGLIGSFVVYAPSVIAHNLGELGARARTRILFSQNSQPNTHFPRFFSLSSVPLVFRGVQIAHVALCCTASWAVGEIALRMGGGFAAAVPNLWERVAPLLEEHEVSFLLPISFFLYCFFGGLTQVRWLLKVAARPRICEAVALMWGRVALASCDAVAPLAPRFVRGYCTALHDTARHVGSDNAEIDDALRGLCAVIEANPNPLAVV